MHTTLFFDTHSLLITCTRHFFFIHTVLSIHRRVATFTSKRPGVHIPKKRRLRKEKIKRKKFIYGVTNIVEEMRLGFWVSTTSLDFHELTCLCFPTSWSIYFSLNVSLVQVLILLWHYFSITNIDYASESLELPQTPDLT